jgi:hypothetical protein
VRKDSFVKIIEVGSLQLNGVGRACERGEGARCGGSLMTTIDGLQTPSPSWLPFLDREHTIARPGYSRWMVPPAALCVHLCIGQAYAFSVFNLPMTRLLGVFAVGAG